MNVAKLGELIRPAKVQRAGSESYPLLSMTMRHGLVPQDEKFKKRVAGADLSQYKVIKQNQLVVGFPIDEAVLAFQRSIPAGIVSPAYGVWDLTDNAVTDELYLERFLRSPQAIAYYKAKLQGSTARRRSLPNPVFLDMEVPFPSFDEQRRIAAVLDKADELRTKRRQALARLDALIQSIFHAVFGEARQNCKNWPTQNIGALLEFGPQNGMYLPASEYGSGAPIVRIDSFRGGVVDELSSLKRLRATVKDLETYGLRAGDILINRVNSIEHLGKAAVVPELEEPTVFESNMMRCRFDRSKVHPEYLRTALQSEYMYNQIVRRAKRAVNQASINQTDVRGMEIRIPPMELQRSFADRVTVVDRLKKTHGKHLAELDALFASLQHRAFKGEL
ncbi:MAG: restriction endonuclease subunit S [Arthrobacter sp.]|nr:restriction endonuclease subunit S [Arthrobacter sp.]MDZ4352849.1 restriction endonuclease subunit S [Arthrobacter sp.]